MCGYCIEITFCSDHCVGGGSGGSCGCRSSGVRGVGLWIF